MASFKLVFLVSFAFFIIFILRNYAESYPYPQTSSRTNLKAKLKDKAISANVGATCRLRCKIPSKTAKVLWYKDGMPLNITKSSGYKVKRRSKQNLEFLKISKMSVNLFGLYTCLVKGKTQGAWRIILRSGGKEVKCRRTKRELSGKKPICGKPASNLQSTCTEPSFPDCKSFAGEPRDIGTLAFIYNGKPVIQIGWKKPENGFNDLWGYQVTIVGLAGHSNHQRCIQLNHKDNITYWTFIKINFDAEYEIKLQSMPSKELFQKKVYVQEKCQFKEFKFTPSCCSIINLNSTVDIKSGTIFLSWNIYCNNKTINIKQFRVAWTNLQSPLKCSGVRKVENSRSNYTIPLADYCQQHNYSIRVSGIHDSNETTRMADIIVSYPQKIPSASASVTRKTSNNTKIFVAVAGVLFGIALVALFFIYKYCFTKVVYKLPDLPLQVTVVQDPQPPGEPLIQDGLKRVFLMSARCCDKCDWVLHCLGELLTSTGLVEVRIDLWYVSEIASGVLRWYEEEIRQAKCVVVLASERMARRNRNIMQANRNNDDLLDVAAQLNLIYGEISRDPNSPKFIPAYFKYNGESSDIPDFLNSRLAHKLPNDLNRLVYHVLNIEAIQPYRTRPIAVLGGDDHPFELHKQNLLQAVREAEEEHQRLLYNNSSIVT